MIKVLFICHGNICRSPMAELVMKDMVRRAGREKDVFVASAATSREELGNPVYPPVRRLLARHGIDSGGKTARQITADDYENFDLLIGMDSANIRNMTRFWNGDPMGKIHRLLDYTDRPGDVADPWYTGDFEATWRDVNAGCSALLFALDSDTMA
jgi:protein-tyrosine phosphatase